jgi:hypothetical protein
MDNIRTDTAIRLIALFHQARMDYIAIARFDARRKRMVNREHAKSVIAFVAE